MHGRDHRRVRVARRERSRPSDGLALRLHVAPHARDRRLQAQASALPTAMSHLSQSAMNLSGASVIIKCPAFSPNKPSFRRLSLNSGFVAARGSSFQLFIVANLKCLVEVMLGPKIAPALAAGPSSRRTIAIRWLCESGGAAKFPAVAISLSRWDNAHRHPNSSVPE